MAWKYNPFTDALDKVGSGGGSYIDGEVEYHSNLPVTVGTPAVNSAFLVRKGEGLYFISRKPAGIWVRELNNGNLDDWKYAGTFSDLYRDANFRIISDSDVTKEIAFSAASIATGNTRIITVPNKNITLDDAGDSRTPTAHAASHAAGTGSDPVYNQNLNKTDNVTFGEVLVNTASNVLDYGSGTVPCNFKIQGKNNADASMLFSTSDVLDGGYRAAFFLQNRGTGGRIWGLNSHNNDDGGVQGGKFSITDLTAGASDHRMVIDDAGNVGFGTADPLEKVHVDGNVRADGAILYDAANDFKATFQANSALSDDRVYTLPDNDGTLALTADIPSTFAASAITSGTLTHERGGLEADVSAYSGLVKISGGATSAVTVTTAGEALLDDVDAAAQRTTLGLGTAATSNTGDFAASSHSHGNLTSAGAIGSTAGLPVITTTSGAITTLALGSANQVLKVNSGGTAVEFGAAGGVTSGSVDNAVLRADGTGGSTSQSSDLIVDDPVVAFACTGDAGTDIITAVGHNFTNNQLVRFQSLTGGAGLFSGGPASSTNYFVRDISGNTFRVSSSSGGSAVNFTTNITAGAVLAVQRNLTLRTRKQAFSMTADAATDVITATGHTFVNGDAVSFYNLTGGNNLDEVSRWFVIEAATNTFKVSNSLNGTARDITTSYTGGTVELEIPFVLGAPRSSALILGDKPDGTIVGGNLRGYGAVDLQTNRNGPNAIASGNFSFIGGGQSNTASATRAIVLGGSNNTASAIDSIVAGGETNAASAQWSFVAGGTGNVSNGVTAFTAGASNSATGGQSAVPCGRNANADRDNVLAQASGRFAAQGDAQTIRVSLRNRASTATAVELFMGFSADTRFTIPSGKTMSALINIIAATSGGEFANRYIRAVTIANRGGTTALRGAVKDIDTDEQIGGADVTISANDTNDAIRIEFSGVAPVTGCATSGSGTAAVINKVAHGYSNNDDIVFTSLTGGAGLTANTVTYWVINATADTFQVSATRGGTSVNISTNYTDMTAARLFRVVAGIDAVEVGHGT